MLELLFIELAFKTVIGLIRTKTYKISKQLIRSDFPQFSVLICRPFVRFNTGPI